MSEEEDRDEELTEVPVGDMLVDLRSYSIRFPGGEEATENGDLAQGLVSEEAVAAQPLPYLAEAFGLLSEHVEEGAPEGWFLEIDPFDRRYEIEIHEGVALVSSGPAELYATVSIGLDHHFDEEFEAQIDGIVEPMLRYAGASHRTTYVSQLFDHEVVVMVRFDDMGGRTGRELIALADDVRALLNAVRSGQVSQQVALNLVLGGHAASLVGQPEGQWLDAKQQQWRLGTPEGNAELAKDISAMANAQGGLILIPARTTLTSGREIIDSVRDLPADLVDLTRIRDVLKQWVFPPLPDLVTELVPTQEGRGRLVVAVGAHRPDNWPHLVVGDPSAQLSNNAVAAWVRDGDTNRPLTAPELHALMRGR
jgi:hypothetical protein